MSTIFYNKLIWITGASSGIGEALVYLLNSYGARLIISARNEQALKTVRENCAEPDKVQILSFDLADPEQVLFSANQVLKNKNCIDYMIHNAGVAARCPAEATPEAIYRQVMETNYFGPVSLTKALLPSMQTSGKGHFVVISSLSGQYGVPGLSAYAASKHALHGFFESLRAEVVTNGIKISMIIPGFVNTPILMNSLQPDNKAPKNLKVNERGMDPIVCAEKILSAIAVGKEVALIGGAEMLTVYLQRFFPGLLRRFIRNHPVRLMNRIKQVFGVRQSSHPFPTIPMHPTII